MKRSYRDLSVAEVLLCVRYDASAGEFYWVQTTEAKGRGKGGRAHKAGDVASRKAAKGYRGVTINGVPVLCHRLAWFVTTGEWPANDVDHENGLRWDNRWSNLRAGSRGFNMQNLRRAHVDTASGLLGAYFDKRRNCWTSRIAKEGITRSLGSFDTAEAAHAAYVAAKRTFHEGCTL